MHEQSIVIALLEQVERHVPAGSTLRRVKVRIGAMRAVEPELMQWAWAAAWRENTLPSPVLELTIDPYELTCPRCGRKWQSTELFEPCTCGCDETTPAGDDSLVLTAIEVEEPEHEGATP